MKLYNLIGYDKVNGVYIVNSAIVNLPSSAFVWADATPEGYELATLNGSEIEGIYAYYANSGKTFFNCKNIIQSLLLEALAGNPANWTVNLNANERAICAKLGLVSKAIRRTIYSQNDDVNNLLRTFDKCVDDRKLIWSAISDYLKSLAIEETITQVNIQDIQRDVSVLIDCFIKSNAPYFSQWIQNTAGSDYENTGFEQKSCYTEAIRDGIMNIYNNY